MPHAVVARYNICDRGVHLIVSGYMWSELLSNAMSPLKSMSGQ